jgi:hypothetical protein
MSRFVLLLVLFAGCSDAALETRECRTYRAQAFTDCLEHGREPAECVASIVELFPCVEAPTK